MVSSPVSPELRETVIGLRMLLLDVDGVMTDGGIILIGADAEAKRFDAQDGMGITLAQKAGLKAGIITGRSSAVVERRASELRITDLFQGISQKIEVLEALVEKYDIQPSQMAYIGDDVQDIPVMKAVGVPIAVQNAVDIVKQHSVYVTRASGGHGAVREAVDWVLDLKGCRDEIYRSITG